MEYVEHERGQSFKLGDYEVHQNDYDGPYLKVRDALIREFPINPRRQPV